MTHKSRNIILKGSLLALIITVLTLFFLISCEVKVSTTSTPGTTTVNVSEPITKPDWEMEWENITREARKEGKLNLYADLAAEVKIAVINAMKEYGIAPDIVSGSGGRMAEKILRERKSGIYDADLYITGLSSMVNTLKPAGTFAPMEPLLVLPEVKDPKLWYHGKLNFTHEDKQIFAFIAYIDHGIHVNTDVVKPGDINSMQDLLSPRWKGKIIMEDPTIPGRGQNWMSVVAIKLGGDYIKQLAKQEPLATRDLRQLIDWVAKGRYPVGLGVRLNNYEEYKRAGAPVSNLSLQEVSYLLAGTAHVAYVDKAPHPNASRVFLNWLLSRKGQTIWQEARMDQSARIDTPIDHLEKAGYPVRKATVDYFDVRKDTWEFEDGQKAKTIITEIFSPIFK